jgi:hypothetical protein
MVLAVRTVGLIHPDERVCAISYVALRRTSLTFRPDGEPCRVKSHSPWCHTSLSLFSLFLFVVLCFFLVIFMCISHVHVSSMQFISSPGMFVYLFSVLL